MEHSAFRSVKLPDTSTFPISALQSAEANSASISLILPISASKVPSVKLQFFSVISPISASISHPNIEQSVKVQEPISASTVHPLILQSETTQEPISRSRVIVPNARSLMSALPIASLISISGVISSGIVSVTLQFKLPIDFKLKPLPIFCVITKVSPLISHCGVLPLGYPSNSIEYSVPLTIVSVPASSSILAAPKLSSVSTPLTVPSPSGPGLSADKPGILQSKPPRWISEPKNTLHTVIPVITAI